MGIIHLVEIIAAGSVLCLKWIHHWWPKIAFSMQNPAPGWYHPTHRTPFIVIICLLNEILKKEAFFIIFLRSFRLFIILQLKRSLFLKTWLFEDVSYPFRFHLSAFVDGPLGGKSAGLWFVRWGEGAATDHQYLLFFWVRPEDGWITFGKSDPNYQSGSDGWTPVSG